MALRNLCSQVRTVWYGTPEAAQFPDARDSGKMTEAPVIVLGHLTQAQRRALVVADNQLALNAGWDEEMLRLELAALQEEDFNLDLSA